LAFAALVRLDWFDRSRYLLLGMKASEAKARFSELLRLAKADGPQEISWHDQERFILATKADWHARRPTGRNSKGGTLRRWYAGFRGLDVVAPRRKLNVHRTRL